MRRLRCWPWVLRSPQPAVPPRPPQQLEFPITFLVSAREEHQDRHTTEVRYRLTQHGDVVWNRLGFAVSTLPNSLLAELVVADEAQPLKVGKRYRLVLEELP